MANARCVVVGGGPGGMILALLLARARVPVTLLEAHRDFNRDFRGDSLHPYTLELLDQLGLADDLLRLPHFRARYFKFHTPRGTLITADYGHLRSRFNCVVLMPQARLLDFLAERALRLPDFELRLGARVAGLLEADGRVVGARCRTPEGRMDVKGAVVVGADGRYSDVRRLAGMPLRDLGASGDLLWFRLPRRPEDPPEADLDLYFGRDHYVGLLGGPDSWQVGYSLPKGGWAAARQAGVEPIRAFLIAHVPWLADRVGELRDFAQTTLLRVELARVDSWHRPGLLLIGDAAHVISPTGGNGLLMAVQDAVAAANRLIPALRSGAGVGDEVLAQIQADRDPAIRVVQAQQVRIEQRQAAAREAGRSLTPPSFLRWVLVIPGVRARAARANAYGPWPPHFDMRLLAG